MGSCMGVSVGVWVGRIVGDGVSVACGVSVGLGVGCTVSVGVCVGGVVGVGVDGLVNCMLRMPQLSLPGGLRVLSKRR